MEYTWHRVADDWQRLNPSNLFCLLNCGETKAQFHKRISEKGTEHLLAPDGRVVATIWELNGLWRVERPGKPQETFVTKESAIRFSNSAFAGVHNA